MEMKTESPIDPVIFHSDRFPNNSQTYLRKLKFKGFKKSDFLNCGVFLLRKTLGIA